MYAPRFPKPQSEGWFVVLCKKGADEVVGIKRVGWSAGGNGGGKGKGKEGGNAGVGVGSRPVARTIMKFPGGGGDGDEGKMEDGRVYDVWVVSDGYMGM